MRGVLAARLKLKRKAVAGTAEPGACDTQQVQAEEPGELPAFMPWWQPPGMLIRPAAIEQ